MSLELLSAVTATNSPPSGATAGVPVKWNASGQLTDQGFRDGTTKGLLFLWDTAGSGTMTVTVRLWGYLVSYTKKGAKVTVGRWAPIGYMNNGAAIAETASDDIGHTELFSNFYAFDRLYAEVTAIGGTSTAISLVLLDLPEVR